MRLGKREGVSPYGLMFKAKVGPKKKKLPTLTVGSFD